MTFFSSLNLIAFLIICWHSCDILDASINNFNCKVVEETVITSFFLCVCINISYVTLKCSVLVKDVEEWLKSALLCKLKKVLLHLSFTSKFHILKTFVHTSDTVTIFVVFIKHCYFIAANVIFDISFCALKTFQHFSHESVIASEITATSLMWLNFKLIAFQIYF